ncbi:hypothetical protein GPECTOR_91g559 [Gonium pectorale]|uniref:Uncharacterized protein n=1 Tax=Gonium pectorale TaxID=33097 RepID=A0A150G1N8_GONPE|nr:hypothetical protein GPECTOR_91g559 [Gonium pectorale]|eukprot:KXZ43405.1 hypothetical protein GPECTOR_91g559 [Gonium pectorale]
MAGNEQQWVELGELTTTQVVERFIKPLTATAGISAAQAWEGTTLGCQLLTKVKESAQGSDWCQQLRSHIGKGSYFGKANYFVSHAWKYKFGDLAAMVEQEWLQGREGFFWVDILAVGQHFQGDFNKNPDSDFGSVIAGADGGLLLTIHPSAEPVTPTRVWCLFEIATAYLKSAPLAVTLMPGNDEQVMAMLILGMILEAFHSYTECNALLQRLIAAAARNTALLSCLSELRMCGSITVYSKFTFSFKRVDRHLRFWDSQDGGKAAVAAGEPIEQPHSSDVEYEEEYIKARKSRLQVLDTVNRLLEAGACIEAEELSAPWLTMGQTIEGIEAMAAALQAPGSRVRRAYLEMLLAASASVEAEGQEGAAQRAITILVDN